jgi:hypothetical protein
MTMKFSTTAIVLNPDGVPATTTAMVMAAASKKVVWDGTVMYSTAPMGSALTIKTLRHCDDM